jgi:hypothetical protein
MNSQHRLLSESVSLFRHLLDHSLPAAFWIAPMKVRFGKKLERPEAANGVRPVSPAPFTTPLVSVMATVQGPISAARRAQLLRPTLVVDTGDEPGHPEFGWPGRRFAIGSAVIEVVNDCPRCASITKEIDADVPQDRAILRHVVKDLGQAVGVYCNVVQPGIITQGDTMVVLLALDTLFDTLTLPGDQPAHETAA